MKNKSFLFRSLFNRVLDKNTTRETRSNSQFVALMLEMVAHSIVGGVATTMLGSLLGFTLFGGLFLDIYSNLSPTSSSSGEVTMVTIGPEALYLWDSTNPNPDTTPREMLAELISILDQAGARTIVLDVLLDDVQEGDQLLAEVSRKHGAVIGAEKMMVNQPRTGRLFAKGLNPILHGGEQPAIYAGHANLFFTEPLLFTGDHVFRGVHHAQFYQRSSVHGQWPDTIVGAKEEVISPSLALAGAWLHRAQQKPDAHFHDLLRELRESCGVTEGIFSCTKDSVSHLPSFQTTLHSDFWLHHMGSEHNDRIPFIPASTLLMLSAERAMFKKLGIPEDQLPPTTFPTEISTLLNDKLVIIGRVDRIGEEQADRYATTYSFPLFKKADMAGVRIQAQVMDALLSGRRLQFVPIWLQLILCLLSGFGTYTLYRRTPILWQIPLVLTAYLSAVGVGLLLYTWCDGWVLELGPALSVSMLTLTWLYTRYEWVPEYTPEINQESLPTPNESES